MAKKSDADIIIVGGGPAGMMAAIISAESFRNVLILERNKSLGKKLSITGKGRCNLTTGLTLDDIIENIPGNGQFLYSSFSQFSNWDVYDFFTSAGLKLKEERGGRIFPQSDKAEDILKVFLNLIKENNVKVLFDSRVKTIHQKDKKITGVTTWSNKFYSSSKVIIATGGISYPGTGSTGDGYKLARQAGHNIISPRPSLTGVKCKEKWVANLAGLTLKNVKLTLKNKDGLIDSIFGEMLFTHKGISGPIVLTMSRKIGELLNKDTSLKFSIDLKPAISLEKLDLRVRKDFSSNSSRYFKNSLDRLFPKSLIPVIISLSCINPEKKVNQITGKERNYFVNLIKDLPLEIIELEGPERAIVTAGGINVKEINPKTMESKLINGLFFAGEVIDVDGFTGGFNLQIAFSTGRVAGISAAISI